MCELTNLCKNVCMCVLLFAYVVRMVVFFVVRMRARLCVFAYGASVFKRLGCCVDDFLFVFCCMLMCVCVRV